MNLDAMVLQELIPWNKKDYHEPVFTCSLSNVLVKELLETPLKTSPFPSSPFKIRTQGTERCVKHVIKAAMPVYGQEQRDAFIRSRLF